MQVLPCAARPTTSPKYVAFDRRPTPLQACLGQARPHATIEGSAAEQRKHRSSPPSCPCRETGPLIEKSSVKTGHQVVSVNRDAELLLAIMRVPAHAQSLPPVVSRTRGRGRTAFPKPPNRGPTRMAFAARTNEQDRTVRAIKRDSVMLELVLPGSVELRRNSTLAWRRALRSS